MILTFFYMYATALQWWRLKCLKNKLNGTLNHQNGLLVTSSLCPSQKCLENLLICHQNRIACTVVPKQKQNLCQWATFPDNYRQFPIYFQPIRQKNDNNRNIYVSLQTIIDCYRKHQSCVIQVENFGELIAWRLTDYFEVILRTDIEHLTKLVHYFLHNDIDINHELELLRIETVEIDGSPIIIGYDKVYLIEHMQKYSYCPVYWQQFVDDVRSLYSKIRDLTNPKIMIENGSTQHMTRKESKKKLIDTKLNDESKKSKMSLAEPKWSKMTHDSKISAHASKVTNGSKMTDGSKKIDLNNTGAIKKQPKVTLEISSDMHRRHKTNDKQKKKHLKEMNKNDVKTVIDKDANNDNIIVKKEKANVPIPCSGSSHVVANSGTNHLNVKPPNILVYADSLRTKENVKKLLHSILNKDRYIIYDLPLNTSYWFKSTILVVVCGSVPPSMTSQLIEYLINGGQLLCLCSDLMYSILHTFKTAEVREHELVHFSYDRWQHVKMMHHIFCYQASPAKKQFSKDADSTINNGGVSPTTPSLIETTPSIVELKFNDIIYNISVDILGMEETWHTPSLLLAQIKDGVGCAIFSQVHLEIDPNEYENDENKYESLKNSNDTRLEILKDILTKHLNIDCTNNNDSNAKYVPGYFLGRYDVKLKMLRECPNIVENRLAIDKLNVIFYDHSVDNAIEVMNDVTLPILIHSCPSTFSTLEYYENLRTNYIGRLLFYIDVIASSHSLIGKQLLNGFVVIARQQNGGVGRSSNKWLSPLGSASFSLQLHIDLNTTLGKYLPLIQNLIITAVIDGVKSHFPLIDLSIKWPNDIYLNRQVKIGGMIVTSMIQANQAIVNCGCGLNLSNMFPTKSLNEEIAKFYNDKLSLEKYFAIIFNRIETLMEQVQMSNDLNILFDLYYKYWLHTNQKVEVRNEKCEITMATVCGIDNYGFLKVRLKDGNEIKVQSNGNSFDFMEGLIQPKIF